MGTSGEGGARGRVAARASFPAVLMAGQWPRTGRPPSWPQFPLMKEEVYPPKTHNSPGVRHVGLSSLDNQMSAEVQVWAFIETAKSPNLRAGDTEFHLQTQRSRQTLLLRLNPSLPACRAWPRTFPQYEAGLSFHRDVFQLVLNNDN